MNLLENLQPLSGTPIPSGELTEASYAQLPFHLLAHGLPPFDAWHSPASQVPAGLEPLWRQAAAGQQLCAFHAVNAVTVGAGFAERILAAQTEFLNGLRPGAGDRHEADLRKLYAFAAEPLEVRSRDGEVLEIPSDWRIAVDFLLTSASSPFRSEDAAFSIEGAPSFPDDVDVSLAFDLEHAWRVAATYFGGLVQAFEAQAGGPA